MTAFTRLVTYDWPALTRFKHALVDPTTERTEQTWARLGIEQVHGRACFVGPNTLAVGDERLIGRRVLIAAGSVPAPLGFPGAERLTTTDAFLDLTRLPPDMIFVGGGYVAFEFAHVVARAGVRATIVHRGVRPLEGFDPDLVDALVERSRSLGIRVELETEVRGVEVAGGRLVVRGSRRGEERRLEADVAVHSAGRVPELEDLDLEAGGVKREKHGVSVNEYLQSVSNPAVYAGGDAAALGPKLTPKADHDASVLATNLLEGNHRAVNYAGIASAVFTLPPLATVGLTEAAARAAGRKFRTSRQDTSGWFNTRRAGEAVSGFKVLVEEDTGHVIGAHLLGPHADEVINLFALAVRARVPAEELRQALYAYPTHGSDVRFMV